MKLSRSHGIRTNRQRHPFPLSIADTLPGRLLREIYLSTTSYGQLCHEAHVKTPETFWVKTRPGAVGTGTAGAAAITASAQNGIADDPRVDSVGIGAHWKDHEQQVQRRGLVAGNPLRRPTLKIRQPRTVGVLGHRRPDSESAED